MSCIFTLAPGSRENDCGYSADNILSAHGRPAVAGPTPCSVNLINKVSAHVCTRGMCEHAYLPALINPWLFIYAWKKRIPRKRRVCERWHVFHVESGAITAELCTYIIPRLMYDYHPGSATTHDIPRRADRQCYDRKMLMCLPTRDRCPCKSFPRSRFPSHIPINPATYQQTIFIITFAFFPGTIQCLEVFHRSIFFAA